MKAILFNTSESEPAKNEISRLTTNLLKNNITLDQIDFSSRRGSDLAASYDILAVPALVLLREDGGVQGIWQSDMPSSDQLHEAIGFI